MATPADPQPEAELPRAIALAWGVAAHPQRGPKRELSIERIVEAAIELADDGGLAAVSMASIATRLGYTPMSLYRYVTSKDDLLVLMQEQGIGLPPEEVSEAESWRDGLARWVRAMVETYREHPWLLDIPITGTPATPNNLAWLDAQLGLLAGTPLGEHEKVAVSLAALAHGRWQGLVERGYAQEAAATGTSPDDVDHGRVSLLDQLVTAEEFPHVHAALEAGVFSPGPVDPFAFGLDRLLDGLDSHIASGRAGELPPAPVEETPEVLADKRVREAVRLRRDAERQLRDARKREREALRAARERARGRD